MLKFNASSYTIMFRCTSRILWQINASLATTATETNPQFINNNVKLDHRLKEKISNIANRKEQHIEFKKLKAELCSNLNITSAATSKIQNAQSVHNLLEIITPLMSQTDITQAVNIITTWANKINESTSRTNPDKNLIEPANNVERKDKKKLKSTTNDFSAYVNLSTTEMIKEINKLTNNSDRNVPLMKYLFDHIFMYNEQLHIAACSNLMYCMSRLNYSDERLLGKISKDTVNYLDSCPGAMPTLKLLSIVKSMSVIRYKNVLLLNYLCDQIMKHKSAYQLTHVANFLTSFAILGYHSSYVDGLIEQYVPKMNINILGRVAWLNLVWSLAAFKRANESHVASILNETFLQHVLLSGSLKKLSHILKVLNINGYAQCVLNTCTETSFIGSDMVPYIVNTRSKQKEMYVDALEVTLKNILPSASHYQMNVNSEMGFLIDAVFYTDLNYTPICQNECTDKKFHKIAVLVTDYHDFCLGSTDYIGLIKLHMDLLSHKNYEVLCIPYQHFGIEDKLEKRITYVKRQLWDKYKKSF